MNIYIVHREVYRGLNVIILALSGSSSPSWINTGLHQWQSWHRSELTHGACDGLSWGKGTNVYPWGWTSHTQDSAEPILVSLYHYIGPPTSLPRSASLHWSAGIQGSSYDTWWQHRYPTQIWPRSIATYTCKNNNKKNWMEVQFLQLFTVFFSCAVLFQK